MKSSVNKRRMVVVGILLLLILTAVLFSLRDVIREMIVIPLSYLFWVIGIFIRSTAQIFFWLAVILIGLLVAWRSIRPKKKQRVEYFQTLTRDSMIPLNGIGRVSYWMGRFNTLRLGSYYHESFNQSVSRLLLDLLAYRHHLSTRQVEQALKQGTLHVPPEIAEFVRSYARERKDPRTNIFTWLFHTIREWFLVRIGRASGQPHGELDPAVRRVMTYMEEELEVNYEQSGR